MAFLGRPWGVHNTVVQRRPSLSPEGPARPFDDAKAVRLHLCGAGAEGPKPWPAAPPGFCFGGEMWPCTGGFGGFRGS